MLGPVVVVQVPSGRTVAVTVAVTLLGEVEQGNVPLVQTVTVMAAPSVPPVPVNFTLRLPPSPFGTPVMVGVAP